MYMRLVASLFVLSMGFFIAQAANAEPYRYNYCNNPQFYCTQVQKGQTWESLFPDPTQRDVVMRLNRMNTQLMRGMTIAVPKDLQHTTAENISPLSPQISPTGNKLILVEPNLLAWGAYDAEGKLVRWGPMSGGRSWCSDEDKACRTAIGSFAVYDKRGAGCVSSKFPIPTGGAPMPYCMFFHGGDALHASPEVPGYNASHGCVRIFYDDARWLNQEFIELGTTVIVHPYS